MKKFFRSLTVLLLAFNVSIGLAATTNTSLSTMNQTAVTPKITPVEARVEGEEEVKPNSFAITFFKPTYILPYYYTFSPDNAVYVGNTPNGESLKHSEVKYQLSFKVPVWQNIFHHHSSLYAAYTQLSYWQLYDRRAFFRETDYEPELFLANELNFHLTQNWLINFLNVGVVHQSNGFGNELERSWNRVYIAAISSVGDWLITVKPWYIISTNGNNNNIGAYLGYAQVLVSYKYHKQVFSVTARNIGAAEKRTSAEATWSFPVTPYIKGYLQVFSGYGQSLIEYNHRTNSVGVGVALSDWV